MVDGEVRWSVVTGGRGFVARHLVEMLIRHGMFHVRVADLGPDIGLEPHEENGTLDQAIRSGRAVYVPMDLRDKSQVLKACEGAEVVFHMAAPDSSINNYQLHYSVNVQGTKNVIDACIELKVKRLIYTSSPSVVFDGIHGLLNVDESKPYPAKHNDSYSETKAEGEKLVVKSNGSNGLLTCCIRPSGIFGPGDRLLVPSLVTAARAGKSKFIIGDGNNMFDFTYVENVVHAHICAERALASEGAVAEKAAGQAYFITNSEPIKFWEFMSLTLEGLGYKRPSIKIPAYVMMPIAYVVEWTYKLFGPYGMKVPQLTPSRIRILTCSRTFSCLKANDLLGYSPIVSLQEGLRRTIDSYPHLRAEIKTSWDGPSKASMLLGNGRVADILLWRDKKQTLTTALVLATIYFNSIAVRYTMITAIFRLLLMTSIFLFIHAKLPHKIFGYNIGKIHESTFIVSEETSFQVAGSVASFWNSAADSLKSICRGADCVLFLKVISSLSILSILGTFSLHSIFVIVITVSFVAFLVYEKKEEQIDHLVLELISSARKLSPTFFGFRKVASSKTMQ